MPYSSVAAAKNANFPTSADGISLTIAQINDLARYYDDAKAGGSADNPIAVAWKIWKGAYKKEGGKWIKKPKKASEGFKYFSELPLKLFEEDLAISTSEIQILRVGKWNHPVYGRFEITARDLVLFKESFESKVRRVDIAVDTEHFPEKGAAAWIKGLMLKGEGQLWALVEWTKWGIEAIKSKAFQYISPEFDFTYRDPETGKKYKNVLHAVTLTNRPFVKDMAPVVLSESLAEKFSEIIMDETEEGGVVDMELKEIVGLVGLQEDATEEQVKDVIKKLSEGSKALVDVAKVLELKEDASIDEVSKKLTEKLAELKTLKEGKDGKITLTESEVNELKKDAKDGKDAMVKLKERDAADIVNNAIGAGKIFPKQKDWANKYALNDPDGFKKFVEEAPIVVPLEERGTQKADEKITLKDSEADRKKLDERAKALMSEKKIDYKAALDMARKEASE